MAMVRMPSSLAARMTRMAISPRLATSRLRMRVNMAHLLLNFPGRGIVARSVVQTGVNFGAVTALAHSRCARTGERDVCDCHPRRRGDFVTLRDICHSGARLSARAGGRAGRG